MGVWGDVQDLVPVDCGESGARVANCCFGVAIVRED